MSPSFWHKDLHEETVLSRKTENLGAEQPKEDGRRPEDSSSTEERRTSASSEDTAPPPSHKSFKPGESSSVPSARSRVAVAWQNTAGDVRNEHESSEEPSSLSDSTRSTSHDYRLCWSSEGACLSLRVVGNLLAFIQDGLILRDAHESLSSEEVKGSAESCHRCREGLSRERGGGMTLCACSGKEGEEEKGLKTRRQDLQAQEEARPSFFSQDGRKSQNEESSQYTPRTAERFTARDMGRRGRPLSEGEKPERGREPEIPKSLLCLLCWVAGFAHEELLRQSVLSLEEQTLEGSTEGEEALKLRRQLKLLTAPCVLRALFACADGDPSNRKLCTVFDARERESQRGSAQGISCMHRVSSCLRPRLCWSMQMRSVPSPAHHE